MHPEVRGAPAEGQPGLALVALVAIVLITVAWWALALHPVTAATPHWLARTQDVCFGTGATGLPSVGGWIVLIGEPVGMVIALLLIWGESLRRDLRWLRARRWGLAAMAVAGLALLSSLTAALSGALVVEETRLPAALTFITTASGITILGVGAPFWGLVAGIGMMVVLRLGVPREPETTGK